MMNLSQGASSFFPCTLKGFLYPSMDLVLLQQIPKALSANHLTFLKHTYFHDPALLKDVSSVWLLLPDKQHADVVSC
jgi:hypothetical protein